MSHLKQIFVDFYLGHLFPKPFRFAHLCIHPLHRVLEATFDSGAGYFFVFCHALVIVKNAIPLPDFNNHGVDTHDIGQAPLAGKGQFGLVVKLEDGFLARAILVPPDQVVNGL